MKAMRLSFLLLTRPKEGVRQALAHPPSLRALLLFLGIVGFLRGLLEALWLYGMAHKQGIILQLLLAEPGRFLLEGALFLAANVMTAYLRWAMYAVLFLGIARWFGRQVRFADLRTLTGLMLGLYVAPVLVNGLYLVFPLPSIKFAVSPVYQPVIGLGQLVATAWFAWAAYHIFRTVCGLEAREACLGALFVPLLDRVLFVGAAAAVFQLKPLTWLPVTLRMGLVTVGFLMVALLAVPFLLWLGRRLNSREEAA